MHFTSSLTALATTAIITVVSAQAVSSLEEVSINFNTFKPGVSYASADHKSILSDIASKVSAQLTNTAFQAELSKIPEAKGHNLEEDVTKVAAMALWSGARTTPFPTWLSALPTTGYGYVAINNDIVQALQSEIKAATSVGTFTGPNDIESSLLSRASSEFAHDSSIFANIPKASIAASLSSLASALTNSLESDASSITHAPASKVSSLGSSLASKASSLESSLSSKASGIVSTSSSTGGVEGVKAQVTGKAGVVGMGALVGGVLGLGVLL